MKYSPGAREDIEVGSPSSVGQGKRPLLGALCLLTSLPFQREDPIKNQQHLRVVHEDSLQQPEELAAILVIYSTGPRLGFTSFMAWTATILLSDLV